jgi:IMP dehydrogenase
MGKLSDAGLAYTFDDFVLVPNLSTLKSRKEPSVVFSNSVYAQALPIFASPMGTVTEEEMIALMLDVGANAVLHRYLSIPDQVTKCKLLIETGYKDFFAAVGASGDYLERAQELYKAGIRRICVDVANGHSQACVDAVRELKRSLTGLTIMAGDVCSLDGTERLADAGADLIRVGIGCGSMCTTRLVTGHGVPQLSALEDCARAKAKYPNVALISDGGIKRSGDIVKALAIGADFVMIGSLLSGTAETPGNIIEEGGRRYKYYAGMASELGRSGWFEASKTSWVPEGVSTKVPYMGKSARSVIEELVGGLRVGMSYSDAHTVQELREKAQWKRVTSFGYVEGTPHGKRE